VEEFYLAPISEVQSANRKSPAFTAKLIFWSTLKLKGGQSRAHRTDFSRRGCAHGADVV